MFLLLLLPLCGGGVARAQQAPKFLLDPGLDPASLDLDFFSSTVWPELLQVIEPYWIPTAVRVTDSCTGAKPGISANSIPDSSGQVSAAVDLCGQRAASLGRQFYREVFTREMVHTLQYPSVPTAALEGYAEGAKNIVFQRLAARGFLTSPQPTDIWAFGFVNSLPLNVAGGGRTFYTNPDPGTYFHGMAGLFELFAARMGGTLQPLDRLLNRQPLRNGDAGAYAALLDKAVGTLDGEPASLAYLNSSATFAGGPDGNYLGILAAAGGPAANGPFTGKSILNPAAEIPVLYFSRHGQTNSPLAGSAVFTATYASGDVSQSIRQAITAGSQVLELMTMDQYAALPSEAVKLEACVDSCTTDLSGFGYFIRYDRPWMQGRIILLANGPRFEDFPNRSVHVLDAGGATAVETYPGFIVVSGATANVTFTDGKRVRTVSPAPISRVAYFTDRRQIFLADVTNAATFKGGIPAGSADPASVISRNPLTLQGGAAVAGSLVTLFTFGASLASPDTASSVPLPASGCARATTVTFTPEGGGPVPAPILYCGTGQINAVVPDIPQGTALVRVVADDGTASNYSRVQVAAADPGIFVVVHADGSLVTAANPAPAGSYISVFATGLGAMSPWIVPGAAAPVSPLSMVINQPAGQLDGSTLVPAFAGMAPGFAGLYQVNIQIPAGTLPGRHTFTLSSGSTSANVVALYTN